MGKSSYEKMSNNALLMYLWWMIKAIKFAYANSDGENKKCPLYHTVEIVRPDLKITNKKPNYYRYCSRNTVGFEDAPVTIFNKQFNRLFAVAGGSDNRPVVLVHEALKKMAETVFCVKCGEAVSPFLSEASDVKRLPLRIFSKNSKEEEAYMLEILFFNEDVSHFTGKDKSQKVSETVKTLDSDSEFLRIGKSVYNIYTADKGLGPRFYMVYRSKKDLSNIAFTSDVCEARFGFIGLLSSSKNSQDKNVANANDSFKEPKNERTTQNPALDNPNDVQQNESIANAYDSEGITNADDSFKESEDEQTTQNPTLDSPNDVRQNENIANAYDSFKEPKNERTTQNPALENPNGKQQNESIVNVDDSFKKPEDEQITLTGSSIVQETTNMEMQNVENGAPDNANAIDTNNTQSSTSATAPEKKNSNMQKILIAGGIVLLLVAAAGGFLYLSK